MTVNHGVLGSSPCSGAFREFSSAGSEHLPYKQRVGGSNPSTPTRKWREIGIIQSLFCFYMCQKTSFLPHSTKKSACCRTLSPFIAWIDEVRINSAVAGIKRYLFSKVFPLRLRRSNPSTPNYIYIPSPLSPPFGKGRGLFFSVIE